MSYLQPANYEQPFQSGSDTSRDAAKRAEKFIGQQGADVLRWFIERGARGGTQREASEALGISRASMCARVHAIEACGWVIKSVTGERRQGCKVYYSVQR